MLLKKPRFLWVVFLCAMLPLSAWAQKNSTVEWQDKASDLEIPTEDELFKNDPDPAVLSAQISVRLKKIQKTIPLDYNVHTQKYIEFYSTRKEHIGKVLGRSAKFFPIFEPILAQYGIPDEMKYLAVVESALNPFAKSPVGACGPWQFMYGTALQYGLVINKRVDERKDPFKSCEAAARYLKTMYNIYGDWHLAIASYNCGPGNVNKAINKAGGSHNFWDVKPFLPKETQAYVPSFIAIVYAMKYAKNLGISSINLDREITTRVILKDKMTVTDLEKIIGIPKAVIIEENPSLLTTLIPANFTLNIPTSKYAVFNNYQDSLYLFAENITTGDKLATPNVVKPSVDETKPLAGDYSTIPVVDNPNQIKKKSKEIASSEKKSEKEKQSKKSKETLATNKKEQQKEDEKKETALTKEKYLQQKQEELKQQQAKAPEIITKNKLQPAQTITPKIDLPEFNKEDDDNYMIIVYKVKQGDNLGFIAKWFHCKVNEIKRWNELNGNFIDIEQELIIYVHKEDYNDFVEFNNLSFRLKDLISDNLETQEERAAQEAQRKEQSNKPLTQKLNPINYIKKDECYEEYTIKSGETLWNIAQKYDDVSVQDLMKWNDFEKTPTLKPGQVIRVRQIKCN